MSEKRIPLSDMAAFTGGIPVAHVRVEGDELVLITEEAFTVHETEETFQDEAEETTFSTDEPGPGSGEESDFEEVTIENDGEITGSGGGI